MLGSILLALGAFAAGAGATYLLRDLPERKEKQPEEQGAQSPENEEQPPVAKEAEAVVAEPPVAKEAEPAQQQAEPCDGKDEKLQAAVAVGLEEGKMSTSLLQRRLGIGYGRALKLVKCMEELGLVGEANGNKARVFLADAAAAYLDAQS